jgi:hypothetical protein
MDAITIFLQGKFGNAEGPTEEATEQYTKLTI